MSDWNEAEVLNTLKKHSDLIAVFEKGHSGPYFRTRAEVLRHLKELGMRATAKEVRKGARTVCLY